MSLPAESALSAEEQIAELQQLVAALTARVVSLENRLEELQSAGFEVVNTTAASSSVAEPTTEAGEFGGPYSWTYREAVAREIGGFLRRALSGGYRGSSGREKIKSLSSRYYLVVRDFEGQVYDRPVRVYSRFADVRAACSRAGDWGDSIFVGVPSKREGSIAARAAELEWPSQVQ